MRRFLWLVTAGLLGTGFLSVGSTAFAQPRPAAPARPAPRRQPAAAAATPAGGVLNLGEITITGRPQKPIATVEVGRIPAKLTLTELKQSFVDRIEEAAFKEPF